MPTNTLIGQFGSGINNMYQKVTGNRSPPAPSSVPGTVKQSVYVDSNISAAIAAGATVSVGCVNGVIPDNYLLSGYVDPAAPAKSPVGVSPRSSACVDDPKPVHTGTD